MMSKRCLLPLGGPAVKVESSLEAETKVWSSSAVPSNNDKTLLELVEVGEDGSGTSSEVCLPEEGGFPLLSLNAYGPNITTEKGQ